jgi:hypothetical protein
MGYRSHVLLAITQEAAVTLALEHPEVNRLFNTCDTTYNRSFTDATPYIIYEWEYVKWYESDPEIAVLTRWMSAEEDKHPDIPFGFLRAGEELTDVEHRGSWAFDIGCGLTVKPPLNQPTPDRVQAIQTLIAYVEDDWGQYAPPDLAAALETLADLRKS